MSKYFEVKGLKVRISDHEPNFNWYNLTKSNHSHLSA